MRRTDIGATREGLLDFALFALVVAAIIAINGWGELPNESVEPVNVVNPWVVQ